MPIIKGIYNNKDGTGARPAGMMRIPGRRCFSGIFIAYMKR
ncbi:hypothetical protein HMPREF0080_00519 [Anaeroglobus geminatus F0357]|uniref:Uncharacterized protein n=1 Tax=Anaeroglobus geminatus F0357 TaxID=861450 RepID=G9YFV6_9FIRM|nr:hypothetical protein HMPREF0080_00519 [Anaeroglobus geminatus F0357]